MLEFSHLSQLNGIAHGITQIGDAVPERIVQGEQNHKAVSTWVDAYTEERLPGVDALITKQTDFGIAVRVADCVPLLIAEPRAGIVGAIHAGWRGTALEIARKSIDFLRMRPGQLRVGIGPTICEKCFVVGPEVARQFPSSIVRESDSEEGKFHVDLWQANVDQCLEVGVAQKHIEVMRRCTLEDETLYSFRGGDKEPRNIAFIQRQG